MVLSCNPFESACVRVALDLEGAGRWTLEECADPAGAFALFASNPRDVCLLGADLDDDADARLQAWREAHRGVAVAFVGLAHDEGAALRRLRRGVDEIVLVSALYGLPIAVARARHRVAARLERAPSIGSAVASGASEAPSDGAADLGLDELLSAVGHDLRNPLSVIGGWVHLLQQGSTREEQRRRALEVIGRQVRIQEWSLDLLRDYASMVCGSFEVPPGRASLGHAAASALDAVQGTAAAFGVELERVNLDPAGEIHGSPALVQRIATILIRQAVGSTPRGGRIRVELVREAERVRLSVTCNRLECLPAPGPTSQERPAMRLAGHLTTLQGGSFHVLRDPSGRSHGRAAEFPAAAQDA